MATFESNLMDKVTRHRGIYEGQEYDVVGRIFLPAGTVLAVGDKLLAMPIGENQVVTKVKAYAVGATGALAVSLGYDQMLDADGQPVKVERRGPLGPTGGTFTSPATNATAYAAGAVLSTARQVVVPTASKLAGPVNMSGTVTAGATLAADVEIFIGATIDGESSTTQVTNPYGHSNDYLLGQ